MKYSNEFEDFIQIFGITLDRVSTSETGQALILDDEDCLDDDELPETPTLKNLLSRAFGDVLSDLNIEIKHSFKSGDHRDSDGEFHHYILEASKNIYYEVMTSLDTDSGEETFYEMYQVEPYYKTVTEFKRIE